MIRYIFINVLLISSILAEEVSQRKPGDISLKKCQEYSKYGATDQEGSFSTKCGKSTLVPELTTPNRQEFPHFAAIGYQNKGKTQWLCGGALISEQYVLSAAHCLNTAHYGQPKSVLLGVASLDDQSSQRQEIDVESVIFHPEYKPKAVYNDLGLIKLKTSAKLDNYTRPACLNTNHALDSKEAVVAAFTSTEYGAEQSRILLKLFVDIISNDECNLVYRNASRLDKGIGIGPGHICTNPRSLEKDTCQGSGGAPVQLSQVDKNQCTNTIIGIVSFGKSCGLPNSPTVSTRVSHYIKWIEDIVWPNK